MLLHSQVGWDSVWQRPQELARGLARHRPVIYFAPVQLHDQVLRANDGWQPVRSMEGGRLLVLAPAEFSGRYKVEGIRRVNQGLGLSLLRRLLRPGGFLYLSNQVFDTGIVRNLDTVGTVMDLIDDFPAFDWAPIGARRAEADLVEGADLVVTGTASLRSRWASRVPHVEYLPSGVNFEAIATPAAPAAELSRLPRPVALYVGSLNDRMDPALFVASARAVGAGSVAVVGPVTGAFRMPEPLPSNLHFFGLKPHSELGGWYQHADVGIMPFADSPAARMINPVKACEFLAAGLPVLSTPIPDVVQGFEGLITIARPDGWESALRTLLATPADDALRARRRAYAQSRGWDKLVDAFEERLRRLETRANATRSA